MTYTPSDFRFALAVGAGGAYVEVTTDVLFDQGSIIRNWGTQSPYTPVGPGTFAFTLDNTAGKYSPDNPNTSLATPIAEGTAVSWSLNGQLRSGTVRSFSPGFADIGTPSTSAYMRITVDDDLGDLSRNTLGNLAYSAVMGSNPYFFWPLNDAAGSPQAAEATGNGAPLVPQGPFSCTFGFPGVPAGSGETQLQTVTPTAPGIAVLTSAIAPIPAYPQGSFGFIGCHITPSQANGATSWAGVESDIPAVGGTSAPQFLLRLNIFNTGLFPGVYGTFQIAGLAVNTPVVAAPVGVPGYWAVGVTYAPTAGVATFTVTLYLNGVSVATATGVHTVPAFSPSGMYGQIVLDSINETETLSHLSHTPVLIHEEAAAQTLAAARLALIDQTTQNVTFGAVPADFSMAPVGPAATSGQSALDAVLAAILTEQGYVDTTTGGSFLAPAQTVRTRGRERPTAVSASFRVGVDLSGIPAFARALNDEVSIENITGTDGATRMVINQTLNARVGSANGSDTILTFAQSDLYEWGSDRIWRGIKRFIDITSITIDAATSSGASLWAALTSLNPGDRIEVTGLPAELGYTAWDGWLIGCAETHNPLSNQFILYLQPCTPTTAIFDTDLWANGGNNTISTALTSGAASLLCTSADGVTLFETVAMNYFLLVDKELVKVTACSAPVAGVQTLTIARAQGGTAAAAHAVGAVPEVVTNSIFAF